MINVEEKLILILKDINLYFGDSIDNIEKTNLANVILAKCLSAQEKFNKQESVFLYTTPTEYDLIGGIYYKCSKNSFLCNSFVI